MTDISNIEAGKTVVMAYHGMFREKSVTANQKARDKNLSVAAAGDRFAEAASAAAQQEADTVDTSDVKSTNNSHNNADITEAAAVGFAIILWNIE